MNDVRARRPLAVLWDHYAHPPALEADRIASGRPFFTPLERFYRRGMRGMDGQRRVLDVGCGYGRNLLHLTGGATELALGLDISAGAIEGAIRYRERFGAGRRTSFVRGELASLRQGDFDLVLATQVINYFDDPKGFFGELAGHVHAGSTVVVSDATRNPRSLSTSAKEHPLVRRLLRRGALSPSDDPVSFHSLEAVIAGAELAHFRFQRVEWAGHAAQRVLGDELHRLWLRRYRRRSSLVAARWLYVLLSGVVTAEDRWRRASIGSFYLAAFEMRDHA
jgi:SAM-dependent methyltransferase